MRVRTSSRVWATRRLLRKAQNVSDVVSSCWVSLGLSVHVADITDSTVWCVSDQLPVLSLRITIPTLWVRRGVTESHRVRFWGQIRSSSTCLLRYVTSLILGVTVVSFTEGARRSMPKGRGHRIAVY